MAVHFLGVSAMKKPLIFAIVGFVVFVCLSVSAGAAEVTIVNPGFEDPALADGDYTTNDCPGWSRIDNGGTIGVWDPGLPGTAFPGWGGNAPEGENIAYATADGIEQVLTATFAVDIIYTLTVEVGNVKYSLWSGYKVQLLAGGTVLAEDNNTIAIAEDTFETSTVTYIYDPCDAALLGQPLQIRLLCLDENEVDFDNVKLVAALFATVDAGDDMLTWSGEPVKLDPNVGGTPSIYLWTADPDDGVVFDPSPNVKDPNVTITKTIITEIAIPNPGFELRNIVIDPSDTGNYIQEGVARYTQGAIDFWRHYDVYSNGGPVRIWNPVATDFPGLAPDEAPEGDLVVRVYTRYNDPAFPATRDSEAAVQLLEDKFYPNTSYTLTVKVGHPVGMLYNGYAVQLVVGGENIDGAAYAKAVVGGTVIAQDYNTQTVPVGTFVTSTVEYAPDPANDYLDGLPLQIRLVALEDPADHGTTSFVAFDDVKLTSESPSDTTTVTLTLLVNDTFEDTMTIDVYDDACQMARIGQGKAAENPGDFDKNCITDFEDVATMVAKWLIDIALPEPVEQ
jgi:hypothetical protein